MTSIIYRPIGIIHTPFTAPENMPIQNAGAAGETGTIDLFPAFITGLEDLDGFSHLILLYHLHEVTRYSLKVIPFMDTLEHGIFSTRAPVRPNPIGMTIVKLISRDGCRITITGVDMLDNTPLLDIKPYLPRFDAFNDARIGWYEGKTGNCESKRSDNRFI